MWKYSSNYSCEKQLNNVRRRLNGQINWTTKKKETKNNQKKNDEQWNVSQDLVYFSQFCNFHVFNSVKVYTRLVPCSREQKILIIE